MPESVAVVGDADDVRELLRERDVPLADVDTADAVVAVGEKALIDVACGGDITVPVLPIAAGGRYGIDRPDAVAAVERLLAGETSVVEHPLLSVRVDGEPVGRGLFDVTLVTSEPARISEYAVRMGGTRSPEGCRERDATRKQKREQSFRADAVVVATPLGTTGYARAAGGPVLHPGTGLSVVPIAPFTTGTETWVAPEAVTLSVERGDERVSMVIDDTQWGEVDPNTPITVDPDRRIPLVVAD